MLRKLNQLSISDPVGQKSDVNIFILQFDLFMHVIL
jgi:hypothetical protein